MNVNTWYIFNGQQCRKIHNIKVVIYYRLNFVEQLLTLTILNKTHYLFSVLRTSIFLKPRVSFIFGKQFHKIS